MHICLRFSISILFSLLSLMIQSPVLPLSICLSHLFIYLASCRDRPMISIMSRCQISIQAIIYFSHPLEPRQDIQSIVPFTYFQQTRHIDPLLDQCWANVVDGGPTLIQHWIGVSYLVDSIPIKLSWWSSTTSFYLALEDHPILLCKAKTHLMSIILQCKANRQ